MAKTLKLDLVALEAWVRTFHRPVADLPWRRPAPHTTRIFNAAKMEPLDPFAVGFDQVKKTADYIVEVVNTLPAMAVQMGLAIDRIRELEQDNTRMRAALMRKTWADGDAVRSSGTAVSTLGSGAPERRGKNPSAEARALEEHRREELMSGAIEPMGGGATRRMPQIRDDE